MYVCTSKKHIRNSTLLFLLSAISITKSICCRKLTTYYIVMERNSGAPRTSTYYTACHLAQRRPTWKKLCSKRRLGRREKNFRQETRKYWSSTPSPPASLLVIEEGRMEECFVVVNANYPPHHHPKTRAA